MKYRTTILGSVVIAGTMLLATGGAWALDLSVNTDTHGAGPLELAILLTLITLAPALLIMVTSFTRIVIVLSLLRQALGLQQTPPNAVLISLALFLSLIIMTPTLDAAWTAGIQPVIDEKMDDMQGFKLASEPF